MQDKNAFQRAQYSDKKVNWVHARFCAKKDDVSRKLLISQFISIWIEIYEIKFSQHKRLQRDTLEKWMQTCRFVYVMQFLVNMKIKLRAP